MKNNKMISLLYVVGLLLFAVEAYAAPTIVVGKGGNVTNLQIVNQNLQSIYVSNFSNVQSQITSGKQVKFSASTRLFTVNGSQVGGLQSNDALGKVNGKYKAQYTLQGSSDWKSLAFDESFYIAEQQVGSTAGSIEQNSVTVDLGSGESLADLFLGLEFEYGGDVYVATNGIKELPNGASYITDINTAVASGKTVTIETKLVKKTGSSGVAVWGSQTSVTSGGTSVLTGGSTIDIDELQGLSLLGGSAGSKTPVIASATLIVKSIGYITNNMIDTVMVSKVGPFSLVLNSDITVAVPGGSGTGSGGDGTGTATGLTGKLKALGNNPQQSAVVSAIQAYATAQSITLNPTTWTGVISPALASANLSSMASSIKTALNIGSESLKDKLVALGSNPKTSDVQSTIENYYHNNMSTIRSEWGTAIQSALTAANLSSKIAALKPVLDKKIKVVSGESAGGRF